MNNEPIKKMMDLHDKIEKSDGWVIYNRIENFKVSYRIFDVNFQELNEFLRKFNDPIIAIEIWNVSRRNELKELLKESARLLHNYLAAAKSLVEHTRVFVNEYYSNSGFSKEYKNKIEKAFAKSEISHFVQDLRNYTLHKELPFTSATLNFERNTGISSSVNLDIVKLRNWKGWTSCSKDYISKLEDKVDFNLFLSEYTNLVNNFYKWFYNRLVEINKDKYLETEAIQKELNLLYINIYGENYMNGEFV
jgi:hypothetical protein